MYEILVTNKFKKDLKLAKKRGKNLDKLYELVDKLAKRQTLETKYKDHSLIGNYNNLRECHIEPDWLLVYEIPDEVLVLILNRTGTHSDIF